MGNILVLATYKSTVKDVLVVVTTHSFNLNMDWISLQASVNVGHHNWLIYIAQWIILPVFPSCIDCWTWETRRHNMVLCKSVVTHKIISYYYLFYVNILHICTATWEYMQLLLKSCRNDPLTGLISHYSMQTLCLSWWLTNHSMVSSLGLYQLKGAQVTYWLIQIIFIWPLGVTRCTLNFQMFRENNRLQKAIKQECITSDTHTL